MTTVPTHVVVEETPLDEPAETILFEGREFRVAEKFGLMPLIRFGYFAKKGLDTDDPSALAAMYDLIRQTIVDDDWEAFADHATEVRASEEDLMDVVKQAIGVMSGRPTRRPSDSSGGPSTTETSSSAGSSSPESLTPREIQRREHLALLPPIDDAVSFGMG